MKDTEYNKIQDMTDDLDQSIRALYQYCSSMGESDEDILNILKDSICDATERKIIIE